MESKDKITMNGLCEIEISHYDMLLDNYCRNDHW